MRKLFILILTVLFATAFANGQDEARKYWDKSSKKAESEYDLLRDTIKKEIDNKKLEKTFLKALGISSKKRDLDDYGEVKILEKHLTEWDDLAKKAYDLSLTKVTTIEHIVEREFMLGSLDSKYNKVKKTIEKGIDEAEKYLRAKKKIDEIDSVSSKKDVKKLSKASGIPKKTIADDMEGIHEIVKSSKLDKADVWDELINSFKDLKKFLSQQHDKTKQIVGISTLKDLRQSYTKLENLLDLAKDLNSDFQSHIKSIASNNSATTSGLETHSLKDHDSSVRKLLSDSASSEWGKIILKRYSESEWPKIVMDKIDASSMYDLLRATILVESVEQLMALSEYIEKNEDLRRKKDRYFGLYKPVYDQIKSSKEENRLIESPSGYRDIQYVIRFPNTGDPYMLAELQINLKRIADVKSQGHSIYDITRAEGGVISAEEKKTLLESREKIKAGLLQIQDILTKKDPVKYSVQINSLGEAVKSINVPVTIKAGGGFKITVGNIEDLRPKLIDVSKKVYAIEDEIIKEELDIIMKKK